MTHADLGPDPDPLADLEGLSDVASEDDGPIEDYVYRMARGAAIGGTAGIPFWQRESIADLVVGTIALNPDVLIRWASKVHDLRESPGGYGPPDPPERQHPYTRSEVIVTHDVDQPPVVKLGPTVHVTQEQLDHAAAIRDEIDAMAAQPAPVPNDGRDMWIAVLEDMMTRRDHGLKEYGTPLQPFNGRDQLADAYAEVLDLAVYLRTAMEERRRPTFSPAAANIIRKYFEANPPTNAGDVLAVSLLNDYVKECAR